MSQRLRRGEAARGQRLQQPRGERERRVREPAHPAGVLALARLESVNISKRPDRVDITPESDKRGEVAHARRTPVSGHS